MTSSPPRRRPRRPRRARRLAAGLAVAGLAVASPAVAQAVLGALDGVLVASGDAGFVDPGVVDAGDVAPSLAVDWSTTLPDHRFTALAAGTAGEVRGRAVLTRDGLALVAAERVDGRGVDLVAVESSTGVVRWSAPEPMAPGCMPVEAADGTLWALLRHPNHWQVGNHALVALDPATGSGDVEGGIRARWGQNELLGCHGGLRELPDGRLAWLQQRGTAASLRVVDPRVQGDDRRDTVEHDLDLDGRLVGSAWTLLPGLVDGEPAAVVTSHADGVARLHVVALPAAAERTWQTNPARVVATVDLPGGPVAATGLLVVDGALLVAAGAHGTTPGHVTRLVGDGAGGLQVAWRSDGPDDPEGMTRPFDPRWLTAVGDGLVARDGADLVGIDLADGAVTWAWTASGAQHLAVDGVGDVIGVAGAEVVGVDATGTRQDGGVVPGDVDHDEPVEVLAVDADGRVLVMATDATTGAARLVAMAGDDGVRRHVGLGRVETAVQVATRAFDAATTAVLARADAYPDALAGGPLAAALEGPLLLTGRSALSDAVRAELVRLGVRRVVLLGGPSALSVAVETELRELMGLEVERIAGPDRFATAAAVAQRLGGDAAYLVEGHNADPGRGWPDAVAVSGVASARRVPILLATRDALPDATAAALAGRSVTVVGGPAAVGDAVADAAGAVERVAGDDRYRTSLAVVEHGRGHGLAVSPLWVATGTTYPDALAAGPAAAATGGSLVLVNGGDVGGLDATRAFLADHGAIITRLELVGGTAAITGDVARALVDAREVAR